MVMTVMNGRRVRANGLLVVVGRMVFDLQEKTAGVEFVVELVPAKRQQRGRLAVVTRVVLADVVLVLAENRKRLWAE